MMSTLNLREEAMRIDVNVPKMPHLREAALATWRGRMVNEYHSATVFEHLANQLAAAHLAQTWVDECRGFANEERRHGVLCGAVVEAFGGEAIAPTPASREYPLHADAKMPLEAALRNVLSICCLSETVAVSLIGAERLDMPEGPLRDLLTLIYSDEVGHARFGWRLLEHLAPTLDAGIKERLGEYLVVAFAHLEQHELEHLPLRSCPPKEGAAVGLCDGASARALFYSTVDEIIVPGLEMHEIPAKQARDRSRLSLRQAAANPR